MSVGYVPEAVILHDVDHGNLDEIRRAATLPLPVTLLGYTDLPASANPYADDMRAEVFFRADHVLIQEDLLRDGWTDAAKIALGAVLFTSARRARVGVFSSNYEYADVPVPYLFENTPGAEITVARFRPREHINVTRETSYTHSANEGEA